MQWRVWQRWAEPSQRSSPCPRRSSCSVGTPRWGPAGRRYNRAPGSRRIPACRWRRRPRWCRCRRSPRHCTRSPAASTPVVVEVVEISAWWMLCFSPVSSAGPGPTAGSSWSPCWKVGSRASRAGRPWRRARRKILLWQRRSHRNQWCCIVRTGSAPA